LQSMALDKMDRKFLVVIILTCIVAGSIQGLLLPLLSYLMEVQGISSSLNGFNSSAIFIGILCTSLMIERPVRRFGYKPVILIGAAVILATLVLYPLWTNLYFWFAVRLLTGAGVTALHYSAQQWIMADSPAHLRGRYISMYGMAYGAGFGIGPQGVNLLPFGLYTPFICAALLLSLCIFFTFRIKNDWPTQETSAEASGSGRYWTTVRLGLLALIPICLYGFMESILTGSFTIFGAHAGMTPEWVAICLSVFLGSSLILQIQLGMLGDKYGRKRVLITVMSIGGVLFMLVPFVVHLKFVLLALFAINGALVGSISSLGISYGVDLLPKHLLPTLGVMLALCHGLASIAGPNVGGLAIQYISPGAMFYILGGLFVGYVVIAAFYKPGSMTIGGELTKSENQAREL